MKAEVIAIAKEKGIQNVIIDEFTGRQYASLLGLNAIGAFSIPLIGKNLVCRKNKAFDGYNDQT